MKRILSVIYIAALIVFMISCSGGNKVRIESKAGAYLVMLESLIDSDTMIERFNILSFDIEGCGLEGEDAQILADEISKLCNDKDLTYMDWSELRLRRAFKIKKESTGDTFPGGCILTFDGCGYSSDDKGEYFTGNVTIWHADFDSVTGLDFVVRYDDGWYLDTEAENGGFSKMIS